MPYDTIRRLFQLHKTLLSIKDNTITKQDLECELILATESHKQKTLDHYIKTMIKLKLIEDIGNNKYKILERRYRYREIEY